MPTLNQFITEIESDFSVYSESNDLDRASIVRWVSNELKRFGNNILTLHEMVIDIRNSQATLPYNFKSLRLAFKVEPFGYNAEGCDRNDFQSYISSKRIENPAYFNEVTLEYINSCKTKVVEEIITLNTGQARICYHPQWLKVVKAVKNNSIATDCLNISQAIRNKKCHEISITNTTLNASFSTGQVYIQYYGLEMDENEEIYIPDGMGNLEKYLEYYCKGRIAEQLIANNKNPQALTQLLPFYEQKAQLAFGLAMTESKFSAIKDGDWERKMKIQNRRRMSIFNLPRI